MSDKRTLYYKADGDADWSPVALHAVDAAHALEADPDHWKAEKPAASADEPELEPEPEPDVN